MGWSSAIDCTLVERDIVMVGLSSRWCTSRREAPVGRAGWRLDIVPDRWPDPESRTATWTPPAWLCSVLIDSSWAVSSTKLIASTAFRFRTTCCG